MTLNFSVQRHDELGSVWKKISADPPRGTALQAVMTFKIAKDFAHLG